ncbi:MAG: DUF554 domain-containing protein [Lachnospiraceae bacterium]|nr:DUF554 domain-containing protein [Lachnospiraceae bacterium]
MHGLGTIINVAAILLGGMAGLIFKRFIKEQFQETIIKANGIAVIFLGMAGALAGLLSYDSRSGTFGTVKVLLMILSLVLGAILGEMLNIEGSFERFGEWLKKKSGNSGDAGFLDAFLTASFTVCIGAMAIIGALQDGISGDYSVLLAKAILDCIIIMIMTASMGKGCIFSAIPVGILQGSVTLLAGLLTPILTEDALANLSMVGNILIFCVGVNLVRKKTIRVANLLPAILFAVLFSFVPWLQGQ